MKGKDFLKLSDIDTDQLMEILQLSMKIKKKINQKDIADSLNLSVATVSKALRGDYSDINSQTRRDLC